MVRPKDGPFEGYDDEWHHLGEMCPQKPQEGA